MKKKKAWRMIGEMEMRIHDAERVEAADAAAGVPGAAGREDGLRRAWKIVDGIAREFLEEG